MIYRFYTEDKHRQAVLDTVAKYHEGFTVFTGQGYWKGQPELSLVIEVLTPRGYSPSLVNMLAEEIRVVNGQQSVLVLTIGDSAWWTIDKTS